MRALVVTAPREAAAREVPDPFPAAGELLVDVERSGRWGADIEPYTGGPGPTVHVDPRLLP